MRQRLAYLDNLKVLLMVGVIAVHSAVTYGFDGTWYLESYDEMAGGLVDALTVVIVVGWLFGLGLFFLIAGRLSGPSLDRKRPEWFARERLLRLGTPVLAYTLLVSPALEYFDYRENEGGRGGFWSFFGDQIWHLGPGPTWFLEALLVFSLGYALLRSLRPPTRAPSRAPLRGRHVAGIALAIAVSSFAAHLAYPIGSEQFHLQLGMFPQYLMLFSLGVAAGRRGWLETLTPELRRRCGQAAAITVLAMPAILLAGGFFAGGAAEDRFAGGWHWQAGAASLTEGVLATCVSLWAIGYFRHHHNQLRPLARRMAPAAYGAFIVHPPVLVGLALAIQQIPVPAELKFAGVLTGGVAASFGLAALAARVAPTAPIIGTGPPSRPGAAAHGSITASRAREPALNGRLKVDPWPGRETLTSVGIVRLVPGRDARYPYSHGVALGRSCSRWHRPNRTAGDRSAFDLHRLTMQTSRYDGRAP